jgi:D-arginine dehydrogenase
MARETDVLIVGGGIAGLATAWWLGRRGDRRVVLVEREEQLGTHSSALNAAILRTTDPDPLVSRLAARGAAFLQAPPSDFAPVPLVDPCGLILLAGAGDGGGDGGGNRGEDAEALVDWVERDAAITRAERLSPAALSRLAPHYAARHDVAFHFPEQGHIDIAALVEGFARGARRAGVEIRTGAKVRELRVTGDRVRGVCLDDGEELVAETTVLAAGGWAGELGRAAGSRVALTPIRRHLVVTAHAPRIEAHWPILWHLSDPFYCKPESGGMMLCGCDETAVHPDRCYRDREVLGMIAEKTARHVPALADAGAAHVWCGMRTMCSDGRFALGFDTDLEGLYWVAGLGGHGMVCGPEVGRLASEEITGEESDDPPFAGPIAELVAGHQPARLVRPVGPVGLVADRV